MIVFLTLIVFVLTLFFSSSFFFSVGISECLTFSATFFNIYFFLRLNFFLSALLHSLLFFFNLFRISIDVKNQKYFTFSTFTWNSFSLLKKLNRFPEVRLIFGEKKLIDKLVSGIRISNCNRIDLLKCLILVKFPHKRNLIISMKFQQKCFFFR